MKRAAALMLTFLAAAGCREVPPDAYFELTGKLVVFNYRVATATYVITLGTLRPIPNDAVLETAFDDPRGGDPMVVTEKIWPMLNKISIESPPVFCIVKDRQYRFVIVIKDGSGNGLQKLEGTLTSSLDQTVLPDVPLVVGNAYEPNPDLAGRLDGKSPQRAAVKCES